MHADTADALPPLPPAPVPSDVSPLYAIASTVLRTDSPHEALRIILATLKDTFGAASGSVALLNPDSGKLEIEVHTGLEEEAEEVALRLGQGITGWVAFHGRPLLVPDVAADPRYVCIRPEVRCEMAVPMLEQLGPDEAGQVLGVINLDSDRLSGFAPADLERLIAFTVEATRALQRLWQLQQLRGKARTLESLLSVGHSLVSQLEPEELLASVVRDARQIAQTRACALYLYEPLDRTVTLAALSNPAARGDPRPALHAPLPIDSCVNASAIHTRKQVEFSNIQGPEFLDLIDIPHDERLRSMLATPLLSSAGDVLGVLCIFTDHLHRFNNDEKRLCAALASLGTVALENSRLYARVFQSEETLRKNEQLTTLGLLAAEIAHEIRNPLTVIKLLFGYLKPDFAPDDPRRTDMRVIGEKLDQLEDIVSRVLNFAKAPSSVHSRWPLADIVHDTLVLIRLKLSQAKIQLRFEPPARPLLVDVHKGQLQQVLLNLLINATQAMPDGGHISITCGSEERGAAELVFVDITDTGSGIPEHLRTRVFDSFLSGRPDGSGLGLAIAKRIVASHHGDLQLLQTTPRGTTMRVLLPLAKL